MENIDKETLTPLSNSGDEDGLLQSGEGRRDDGRRSVSPSDPVESLSAFTRKVGAFVNKPNTQVINVSPLTVLSMKVGKNRFFCLCVPV